MLFKFPQIEEMTDDTIDVMSSSSNTADVSPIPLKVSDKTRLRFVPIMVNNPNDPQKSVEGKIVFERKKKADTQFPSEHPSAVSKITKSSIKTGDWLELKLNTSETLALYEGLGRVYGLFKQLGSVPTGFATYTRVDSVFKDFLEIMQNDPQAAVMLGDKSNYELVKILLEKITCASSFEGLRESLSNLQNENLNNLSISLNIERLQRVAHLMADVCNIKLAFFRGYQCIEYNVHDDVAKLLAYFGIVVVDNGIAEFIGFFYGVGAQTVDGLLLVPGTLLPKFVHDVEQAAKSFDFLLSGVHDYLAELVNYGEYIFLEECFIAGCDGSHSCLGNGGNIIRNDVSIG